MSARQRRLLIGLLALAAMVLAWFAPEPDPLVPAKMRAGDVAGEAATGGDSLDTAGGRGVALRLPPLRAWPARRAWEPLPARDAEAVPLREPPALVAAAAASKAAQPAAPATPKLPFRYLGALDLDGATSVFLAAGNDTLTVHPGTNLPGGWRFDSASAGRLDFTFLPTDSRQSLTIAAP
jgi:hypothetical protein